MKPFVLRAGLALAAVTLLGVGVLQRPVSGVIPTTPGAARSYTIQAQGPTTGWQSFGNTINDFFQVDGGYMAPGQPTLSFFTGPEGLRVVPAVQGFAHNLINDNNATVRVGYYYNINPSNNAQRHHLPFVMQNGKGAYLPREQGGTAEPRAITTTDNVITGWCTSGNRRVMAVWTPDGNGYDLEHPPLPEGTVDAIGFDINERKTVVGAVVPQNGVPQAYELARTQAGWFGRFFPRLSEVVQSIALSNNNLGQTVGRGSLADGMSVGLIWKGSEVTRVDPPAGFKNIRLQAVNDLGLIIGTAWVDNTLGPNVGCIIVDGQLTVLSSLIPPNSGWVMNTANDLGNSGGITGAGQLNGAPRAYRLTPTFGRALPADLIAKIGTDIGGVRRELETTEFAGNVSMLQGNALNYLDNASKLLGENPSAAADLVEAAIANLTVFRTSEDTKDKSDNGVLQPQVERLQSLLSQINTASAGG
jgi:hypothetical protein